MRPGTYFLVHVLGIPAFNRWFPATKGDDAQRCVQELRGADLEAEVYAVSVTEVREADLN